MRDATPTAGANPPRTGYDTHRREAFEARLFDVLNGGALALMASIGRRTRLFDAMADAPPATARQLADAARLDPHYVEAWLAVMVSGGVVLPVPGDRYRLPSEHAAHLTRDAGPDDLTLYCEALAHLSRLEDDLVACFHSGAVLPEEFFVALPARDLPEEAAEDDGEPPLAPFLHAIACARGAGRG